MILGISVAYASTSVPPAFEGHQPASSTTRPRICLVLSGGGARGYAHIGVLKELERLHVPIDCIAGTSMGAVIGGLYASGMRATEIEAALAGIDLTDVAFDRSARHEKPEAVRSDEMRYPLGLPLGFGDGRIKTATGLVYGKQLLALLQANTSRLPGDVDFDNLPVPFRAVATDLETGQMVVLRRGSLPLAIRASMAVPGLFAPVPLDGRTLVDGGVVRNLPVDIAREMGADIVIAVNIGTPLRRAGELTSMAGVTQQMVGMLIGQNVRIQKASLRPSDILLEPDLGDLSFTDFAGANKGIAAGAGAVERDSTQFAALSVPPEIYATWLANRNEQAFLPPDTHVDRVEVTTVGPVPAARVAQALHTRPGDAYDAAVIGRDLQSLDNSDDFQSVSQTFTGPLGDRVLKVEADSKSWGPNFLLFGLGLSSNFSGDGDFTLRIGHRRPWLTQSGLSWRNDIVLGSRDLYWRTELRQPLFSLDGIYIGPYASIKRSQANVYNDDADVDAQPVAIYRQQELRAGVAIGMPLGKLGEVRAEAAQVHTSNVASTSSLFVDPTNTSDIGTFALPSFSTTQTVIRVEAKVDQLDQVVFPRHGYFVDGYAEMALDQSEGKYNTAQIRSLWATSYGVHSVNVALEAGGQFGHLSDDGPYNFTLGGFQHLAAYAPQQFSGNYVLYGRVTYLGQLKHLESGPMRDLFIGTSLEAGNVWSTSKGFGRGPWRSSASVFLGMTTSLGPLYLGVAAAPAGVHEVYFQLGNQFW
ncbi:patatin [Paraburkholderia sp. DHOC27]|nr:patatin [Paraburkholderia sp. DHOC27]